MNRNFRSAEDVVARAHALMQNLCEEDEDGNQWFVYRGETDSWILRNDAIERLRVETDHLSNLGIRVTFPSLRHVKIASSVQEIEDDIFSWCRLETVEIIGNSNHPSQLARIGDNGFSSSFLTSIDLSHCSKLSIIETWAFYCCSRLETIKLPPTLQRIEDFAFASCSALKEIILPQHQERISQYTFSNCKSLKTITLPPNLQRIEWGAFADCLALQNIRFPEACDIERALVTVSDFVTDESPSFARCSFGHCASLSTIRFDSIQTFNSLHSFGIAPGDHASPFRGCRALNKIDLPPTAAAAYFTSEQIDLLPKLFWINGGFLGPIYHWSCPVTQELLNKWGITERETERKLDTELGTQLLSCLYSVLRPILPGVIVTLHVTS